MSFSFFLRKLKTSIFRRFFICDKDFPIHQTSKVICKKNDIIYYYVLNDMSKMSFDDQLKLKSLASLNPLLGYTIKDQWWTVFIYFPEKPFMAKKVEGILAYLPVFGGCTYVKEINNDACIYGFATNSSLPWDNSERDVIDDFTFLKQEAENFVEAIQIASKSEYESAYILAASSEERINIVEEALDEIRKAGIPIRMPTYSAMLEMGNEVIKDMTNG